MTIRQPTHFLPSYLVTALGLTFSTPSLAVEYTYPTGSNINQVQLQSLINYRTVCDSSNTQTCDVPVDSYQQVVFVDNWSRSETSVITIDDSSSNQPIENNPANNANNPTSPMNVQGFVYGDDFVELQFDRLPADVFPQLRRDGIEVASNGTGSSSLIFRGSSVRSGSYELIAVRTGPGDEVLPESLSISLTIDLDSRIVTVSQSPNTTAPPLSLDSGPLSDVDVFVYGSNLAEITFSQLPNNVFPQLRFNDVRASNGVGSSSLVVQSDALLPSGIYQLLAINSSNDEVMGRVDIDINFDALTASLVPVDNQPPSDVIAPPTANTLTANNAVATIRQAFEVMTGRAYDQRLVDFSYVLSTTNGEAPAFTFRDCENDGSLTQQTINNDALNIELNLSNCESLGDSYDGSVNLQLANENSLSAQFNNGYSASLPSGSMSVSGNYRITQDLSLSQDFSVSDLNYFLTFRDETLRVNNATTQRVLNPENFLIGLPTARMSGIFSMAPPALNGEFVVVSVPQDFTNTGLSSQIQYETGQMFIVAQDSQIFVDADNGDDLTVDVSVTDANGNITTSAQPWTVWQDALAYSPPLPEKQQFIPTPNRFDIVIDTNNYRSVLTQVLGVFNGETAGADLLAMPDLYPVPDFPENFLAQFPPPDVDISPRVQACENEGQVTHTPHRVGFNQIASGWESEFENCLLNGTVFRGNFRTQDRGNVIYSADDFTASFAGFIRSVTGEVDYKHRNDRDGSISRNYVNEIDELFFLDNDQTFSLNNASTRYQITGGNSNILSGQYVLQSRIMDNQVVHVDVVNNLHSQYGFITGTGQILMFETGLLGIDAGAGNQLWLNANTGNPDTFDVTILAPGSAPVVISELWLDWQDAITFKFDLLER